MNSNGEHSNFKERKLRRKNQRTSEEVKTGRKQRKMVSSSGKVYLNIF